MTRQEITERLQAIGTCENDVERRELIAQLTEDAGADYDALAAATEARDQLARDNEDLRAANMKLFMRIGDHKEPDPEPEKKKLKFEDLFDDKGGLK